jgi:hypothetical protein
MLRADDLGIGVRSVIAALFGPCDERGFGCLEPQADERH